MVLHQNSKSIERGAWVFGLLLLVFFALVFFFAPDELPPFKHRQLGLLCALLSGLFVYFFINNFELKISTKKGGGGWLLYRGLGGTSVFFLVLTWWSSPYTVIGIERELAEVRDDTRSLRENRDAERRRTVDALTPNLSAHDALEHIYSALDEELTDFELVEVLGSYYVCVELPDQVFFRYPEWLFTFGSKSGPSAIEVRVSDSNVSYPPAQFDGPTDRINYYVVTPEEHIDRSLRKALETTSKEMLDGDSFKIWSFDNRNLAVKGQGGYGESGSIPERTEADGLIVVARAQAVRRAKRGDIIKRLNVQSFDGSINRNVEALPLESVGAMLALRGFSQTEWKIDIETAIEIAVRNGALPRAPGMLGWPGLIRLYYRDDEGLDGVYWHLPYAIDLGFFVVDATTGETLRYEGPGGFRRVE